MENRKVVKGIALFAKMQWKQTKPKTVEVRRVKDKKTIGFGFPPAVLLTRAPIKFVVCVEFSDVLRIYHFSRTGQLVSAKNFERPFEIRNEVVQKSKLVFKLPQKPPLQP